MTKIEELQKCSKDPVYFINNYTDFKLYPYQEKLIYKYHNNRLNICEAQRQSGRTTMGILYTLHHIIFNDNVRCGMFYPQDFICP